tara:strand:- start:1422 stop:1610 length:189 start_codon:yes stop_codon:yes gene_type:complete
MNINNPSVSRELAFLMNIKRLSPLQKTQFITAARKAKNMENFKKNFEDGVIYDETVLPLFKE